MHRLVLRLQELPHARIPQLSPTSAAELAALCTGVTVKPSSTRRVYSAASSVWAIAVLPVTHKARSQDGPAPSVVVEVADSDVVDPPKSDVPESSPEDSSAPVVDVVVVPVVDAEVSDVPEPPPEVPAPFAPLDSDADVEPPALSDDAVSPDPLASN